MYHITQKGYLVRKVSIYGVILGIIFLLMSGVPNVKAYTNLFVNVNSTTCASCANPITGITDTATTINDLMIIALTCQTSYVITGITDTATNSWSQILSPQSYSIPNNWYYNGLSTSSTTYETQYWFASAKGTSASTASITTSTAETNCVISVSEGNTPFIAFSSSYTSSPTSLGIVTTGGATSPISTTTNLPANSITFVTGIQYISTNGLQGLSSNAIPPLQGITANGILFSGLGSNTAGFVQLYAGSLYTNTQTSAGIGYSFQTYQSLVYTTPVTYALIIGLIFSTTGTISTSQSNQVQVGCGSTFKPTSGSSSTAINANYTYWFMGYTNGGISGTYFSLTNSTIWISSITLHKQPIVDIYLLVWLSSATNVGLGSLPSPTNLYNVQNVFPAQSGTQVVGKTVLLSVQHFANTTNPFKLSTNFPTLFSFSQGISYAVGMYVTHTGVKVVNCGTSPPTMYNQKVSSTVITNSGFDVTFCGASSYCSGPLNSANSTALQPYLYAGLLTPSIITLQTITSTIAYVTVFSTITSIASTTTYTATLTQTTTVITNALQGGTGGAQMITNLITYFPIWFLPLIFGFMGGFYNFGLGGLLFGLMLGLTLGVLDGQLPLWTVFVDALMIYLLLRR